MPRLLPASLSETELPLVFCKKIIRTAIPHGNLIENNVYVQVGKIIDGKKEWLNFKSNNWETNDDPGFADWKNANFSLKSHLHIFREIPSFKEIPFLCFSYFLTANNLFSAIHTSLFSNSRFRLTM